MLLNTRKPANWERDWQVGPGSSPKVIVQWLFPPRLNGNPPSRGRWRPRSRSGLGQSACKQHGLLALVGLEKGHAIPPEIPARSTGHCPNTSGLDLQQSPVLRQLFRLHKPGLGHEEAPISHSLSGNHPPRLTVAEKETRRGRLCLRTGGAADWSALTALIRLSPY